MQNGEQQTGAAGQPPAGANMPGPNEDKRLQQIATALGITVDEVRTQRQNGKTLVALIEEKGLDKEQVLQKLVELEKSRLKEEIDSGRMTQEQADKLLEDMKARGLAAWEWAGRQQPLLDRRQGGQSPRAPSEARPQEGF
ncbi:MAG: hypothetical protein ACPLXA_13565 [Moorellaceae bacterium]